MSNETVTDPFQNCTQITPACPVEATTYGYIPNLAGNIILLIVFFLTAIGQLGLGIKFRLPSFGTVMTIGCFMEGLGYIGRILMHNNVWNDDAFRLQVVCLILAPSFLAAGIYLTVKHIVMALGPELSRLPPKFYTWIFISADAFSIVLQAIGGGLASAADPGDSLLDTGNNLMIAGIAVQVVTMAICFVLAIDFGFSLLRSRKRRSPPASSSEENLELKRVSTYSTTRGFYFYLACTAAAFLFIFIRCIYRLPEMAGGWGNELMQEEATFMVLDGMMVALAAILMTIAHPGFFFPEMRVRKQKGTSMLLEPRS